MGLIYIVYVLIVVIIIIILLKFLFNLLFAAPFAYNYEHIGLTSYIQALVRT